MDNGNSENHFEEGEDPLNPKPSSNKGKLPEKKKPYQRKKINKIEPLLSLNFESRNVDNELYHIINAVEISLIEIFNVPQNKLRIDEVRYDKTFVYYFENLDKGLSGYIGRDKNYHNSILYVIKDNSRLKWARQEGFLDATDSLLVVYEKIGILRRAKSINDFMSFLAGFPNYHLVGEYLVG